MMKPGPDHDKILPHQPAVVMRIVDTFEENALNERSKRKGCMGTWRMDSNPGPKRNSSVPWMSECVNRSKDSNRNADLDKVARVNGRNRSI